MFQFVLLMGKSMFWKKEIYENTPENSTKYSYIFVFFNFLNKKHDICVYFEENSLLHNFLFLFEKIKILEKLIFV